MKRFLTAAAGAALLVAASQASASENPFKCEPGETYVMNVMIYFENVDGRVCILFPYLGRVLIGSTDIRVDEPGEVRCEDAEVDYILKSLANVFPGITVRPEQIVYRFAGVRPLPRSDKAFTGRISRDHERNRHHHRRPADPRGA